MVNFQVAFFCPKTSETKLFNVTHPNFASVASWAYVEKRCLLERTDLDWKIAAIYNLEFDILKAESS
jgi:hypothetical protein